MFRFFTASAALVLAAVLCDAAYAGSDLCEDKFSNGALQGCKHNGCPTVAPNCGFIYSIPGDVNSTPVTCSCQ